MFHRFIERFTPRASPRSRTLSAAIVWSGVGLFLIFKGVLLLRHSSISLIILCGIGGAFLGLLKSAFIFDRVASKIVTHIGRKPMRACLGGVFSIRNWMLIAIMALFGRLVGTLPLNGSLKTVIYVMVGSGLAYSSRLLWNAWKAPATSTLPRL